MAVLFRLGNPALLTAQEGYAPSPVSGEGHSTLTLPALVMGIPLEKVNQHAASPSIGLATQTRYQGEMP